MSDMGIEVPIAEIGEYTRVKPAQVKNTRILEPGNHKNLQMDDEYNSIPHKSIAPLKDIKSSYSDRIDPHTTELVERQFEYLSATRDLDTASPLAQNLQIYVNKMAEGTNLSARVVIMKKGESPEAMVYPDGTIFISQSLINAMNTYDEIAGILAHELGHLINNTYELRARAIEIDKTGVKWVHELASDVGSLPLLEKAGLRTDGLGKALENLKHIMRGTAHQAMLQRAAEVAGAHYLVHYETSNNTPVPLEAKNKIAVRPTNYEIASKALKEVQNVDEISQILLKLHKDDFIAAYETIGIINSQKQFDAFALAMTNKLISEGYTKAEIEAYILTQSQEKKQKITHYLTSSDQIQDIASALRSFVASGTEEKMNSFLFNKYELSNMATNYLLDYIKKHAKFIEPQENRAGVYFTENQLLNSLASVCKVNFVNTGLNIERNTRVQEVLKRYLDEVYIYPAEFSERNFDALAFQSFLQKAKERGLPIDEKFAKAFASDLEQTRGRYISQALEEKIKAEFVNQFPKIDFTPSEQPSENNAALPAEKIHDFEKDIDDFLAEFETKNSGYNKTNLFDHFLTEMRNKFRLANFSDAERAPIIKSLLEKVKILQPTRNVSLLKVLDGKIKGNDNLILTEDEIADNKTVNTFNMRLISIVRLFSEDGQEFYDTLEDITKELGLLERDLSRIQLFNLADPLFNTGNEFVKFLGTNDFLGQNLHMYHGLKIKRFEKLASATLIQKFIEKQDKVPNSSIQELLKYTQNITESSFSKIYHGLYSDSLPALFFYRDVREAFSQVVRMPSTTEDLPSIYKFVSEYLPDDPATHQILKEIHKRILNSDMSVREKIKYLKDNVDSIGFEGMSQVADQIMTFEDYCFFHDQLREKIDDYLRANHKTTILANVEYATSEYTKEFEALLKSAYDSDEAKVENTTKLAKKWIETFFGDNGEGWKGGTEYDPASQKVLLKRGDGRTTFRSFEDVIKTLKDSGKTSRLAVAMRALVDQGGAFSNEENRKKLGQIITETLKINGFVANALQSACEVADPSTASFPVAAMVSPLLFRGLGADSLNLDAALEPKYYWQKPLTEYIPEDRLQAFIHSPTREIVAFGSEYASESTSLPWQLTQKSLMQYYEAFDSLKELFPSRSNENGIETKSQLQDKGIDAVIDGVQASGALGVRAMQLMTQLFPLSSEMHERLSQSFDSNPGLNKLLFWENLYRRVEIAKSDPQYQEQARFITDQLITLDSYLGGGSLYTTYGAVAKDRNGDIKRTVVKMLNPNAAYMIGEYFKLAQNTFVHLKEVGSENDKRHADSALMLLSLSHEWCLQDINDPTFEHDDDLFRVTLQRFNAKNKREVFDAPHRVLTSYHLKSEIQAEGKTLNSLLNDAAIPREQKQEAVRLISELFNFQLTEGGMQLADGDYRYLIHSDPHPGNYIVNTRPDGQMTIDVIDRNMYLKLNKEQASAMKALYEGNNIEFFIQFIRSVCLDNKVRSPLRVIQVLKDVGNAARQEINKNDQLLILQTIMNGLEKKGLTVPLELRLMLRNVVAMQELTKKYQSNG